MSLIITDSNKRFTEKLGLVIILMGVMIGASTHVYFYADFERYIFGTAGSAIMFLLGMAMYLAPDYFKFLKTVGGIK